MINAEHLRIGNYVLEDGNVRLIEFGSDIDLSDEFEPMPLNEELLLRLGFTEISSEEDKTFVYRDNRRIKIKLSDSGHIHLQLDAGYWGEVKHVHVLQNVFHALIGEKISLL